MSNFFRHFIRASSFFRKEIFEILRQPRLVITLVLGPFLILFLFGIGFHNQARPLRTWFIAQPDSPLAQDIDLYTQTLNSQIIKVGMSTDLKDAINRLSRGEVDVVIATPADAYNTVLNNQQAVFTLYYNEIDPGQVSYIQYMGVVFADTINREVLKTITSNGQKESTSIQSDLQQAHQNVFTLRQAIQGGDTNSAQQSQQSLNNNINAITLGAGASLALLTNIQQTGASTGDSSSQLQGTLTDLQQNNNQLMTNSSATPNQRLAYLDKIEKDLTILDSSLGKFQSLDPNVIISPFKGETKSIALVQPTESDFFAPMVLALLLQHMAVTFAALSIVRERNAGTMELFRVSPLSAGEALLGKYVSYMLFGIVIATILTALIVFVLHVPMLGNWWYFALVIVVLLFTSMGFGFTISILSQTDSQAVQYSMILLLACVFFSGFFINLVYLINPVKLISWILPTTYGGALLQDIFFRGINPDWRLLGGLAVIGLILLIIAWLLMIRLVSSGNRMLK